MNLKFKFEEGDEQVEDSQYIAELPDGTTYTVQVLSAAQYGPPTTYMVWRYGKDDSSVDILREEIKSKAEAARIVREDAEKHTGQRVLIEGI